MSSFRNPRGATIARTARDQWLQNSSIKIKLTKPPNRTPRGITYVYATRDLLLAALSINIKIDDENCSRPTGRNLMPAQPVTNRCFRHRLNNKGRLRALYYLIPKIAPLTVVLFTKLTTV